MRSRDDPENEEDALITSASFIYLLTKNNQKQACSHLYFFIIWMALLASETTT